jgi:hypothetical protein
MSFSKLTKPLNKVRSTIKYGDIGGDAMRVGKGKPVNLSSTRRTAYGPGQSPGHKAYMSQWGEMPKETRRGVQRVDSRGRIDDYTE